MTTIRQHLKAMALRMNIVLWIGLVVAIATQRFLKHLPRHESIAVGAGVLAVFYAIAYALSPIWYKCPSCGMALRESRNADRLGFTTAIRSKDGLGACPNCNASFDQETA